MGVNGGESERTYLVTIDDVVVHGSARANRATIEAAVRAHIETLLSNETWRTDVLARGSSDAVDGGRLDVRAGITKTLGSVPARPAPGPGPDGPRSSGIS